MVNQVRTLLLNATTGGDEYVPAGYVPPALPAELRAARQALFGPTADPAHLAARVDRLLAYAHASVLAPDLTAADPRLTYDPYAPARGTAAAVDPDPPPFAAAGLRTDLDGVFRPAASVAEAGWYAVWVSAAPAADRAVALALALAARTAELAGLA